MKTEKVSNAAAGAAQTEQIAPLPSTPEQLNEAFLVLLGQMLGVSTARLVDVESAINFASVEPQVIEQPAHAPVEQAEQAPADEQPAELPRKEEEQSSAELDKPVVQTEAQTTDSTVIVAAGQQQTVCTASQAQGAASAPDLIQSSSPDAQTQQQPNAQLPPAAVIAADQSAAGASTAQVQEVIKAVQQQQSMPQPAEAAPQQAAPAPAAPAPASAPAGADQAAAAEQVPQPLIETESSAQPKALKSEQPGQTQRTEAPQAAVHVSEAGAEESQIQFQAAGAAIKEAPSANAGPNAAKDALSRPQVVPVAPAQGAETGNQPGTGGLGSGSGHTAADNLNLGAAGKGERPAGVDKSAEKGKKAGTLPQHTQDQIIERIKELLKNAETQRQGNSLVIRLDPPELGNMILKITNRDKNTFVRIIPETPEVESTLRQRLPELVQSLAGAGLNARNVHVSIGAERSETELYQFNQFLRQHGEGRGQENFTGRSNRGDNQTLVEAPLVQLAETNNQEPGWVA